MYLPPDLLREISGHLHDAADFIRFHAVCKPWRESHDPTTHPSFLPWLLAPDKELKSRCVFSKTSYYRAPPLPRRQSWVASADGTAVRYLAADGILHDPLKGAAATPVPPFPDGYWTESPSGTVYGDGTVLLYTTDTFGSRFTAALLRPGDAAWTLVERSGLECEYGELCAAYYGGKILLTGEAGLWHAVNLDVGNDDDVLIPMPWTPREQGKYIYEYSYVLESRGELLWASVQMRRQYYYRPHREDSLVRALSVWVHALQEAPEKKKETTRRWRWVRKDGRSLADRVLFLGWPNSFAVDASRLRGGGGYAYFVHWGRDGLPPNWRNAVFRYDLVHGKNELVEWLPQAWKHDMCAWLVPQPSISPIQEIHGRLPHAPKWRKQQLRQEVVAPITPTSTIQIDSPQQQPCSIKVLVRNLPLTVNSSRLQYFFSKHGKVSSAEVICYKKTKTSQGIGLVTMATEHSQQADALAALNGLVLDGCSLQVSLVKKKRRRRRTPSTGAA